MEFDISWIWDFWHGLGGDTKSALIQGLATLAAAMFGALAISRQIKMQGEQSRGQILGTERRRLKSIFYDEIATVCAQEQDANLEYSSWLRGIDLELRLHRDALARNLTPFAFSRRVMELNKFHSDLQKAAIDVIFLIERRLIFDPRILVFRTAINVALHDLRESHQELFSALMFILPVDLPNGTVHPGHPPDIEQIDAILPMIAQKLEAALSLSSWLSDFLVEMQNLLLGDIFEARAPIRNPLDPSEIVVTLDRASRLELHFEAETSWGKTMRRIEAETKERFANTSDAMS